MNDLREAIAGKDSGNLAVIELSTLPRELQPIVLSVNRLLERLRSTLKAEREFTANSAHELRTPLAGALAQTQMLKSELRSENSRSRLTHIEASLQRLIRLVEKLMQLARAEARIGTSNETVDLGNVLELIIEDFHRASGANDRIQYTKAAAAALRRPVSEDAFAIVLRNLIENALIHGDQKAPVRISFERGGTIRIANDGPVLAADELKSVRQRFARGKTMSPGSGLGLSIATELATQMDATLELISPATNMSTGVESILRFNG
ncbi:HAMP domain-containing sensor histidine kinase [Phyllobacterium sp. SB3]|uniref:sensor histidine kinase n=1 Tax=Phyllobacterium sp. SB3 TaxID=3156073 RepID=UPI0032AF270C